MARSTPSAAEPLQVVALRGVLDLVNAGKLPASLLALALILWVAAPRIDRVIEVWAAQAERSGDLERRVAALEDTAKQISTSLGRNQRNLVALCTVLDADCEKGQ